MANQVHMYFVYTYVRTQYLGIRTMQLAGWPLIRAAEPSWTTYLPK